MQLLNAHVQQLLFQQLVAPRDEQLRRIEDYAEPLNLEEPVEAPAGDILHALRNTQQFLQVTSFAEDHLTALFQAMQPHIAQAKRRGPRPKSSYFDMLLCYLMWAKTGRNYLDLAKQLHLSENRLEDNIARIRPILLATLVDKWWSRRERPVPLAGTNWPHAALLIDTTTVQAFRPIGPFEEAKIYWDGAHKIYGLKVEVAVQAHAPHYCLFTTRHVPGSVHDYKVFKDNYQRYLEFLHKTPGEQHQLPQDQQHRLWAVIADKAYVGPAADTPDVRRIVPHKNPHIVAEQQWNQAVGRIRVKVEHFFGRLYKSWGILENTYRWDHAKFNEDFDICCLLTNDLVQTVQLDESDYLHYHKFLQMRQQAEKEHAAKRQQSQQAYNQRKRMRGGGVPAASNNA